MCNSNNNDNTQKIIDSNNTERISRKNLMPESLKLGVISKQIITNTLCVEMIQGQVNITRVDKSFTLPAPTVSTSTLNHYNHSLRYHPHFVDEKTKARSGCPVRSRVQIQTPCLASKPKLFPLEHFVFV